VETVPWLPCIWRRDRASVPRALLMENGILLSKKTIMDKTLENTLKVSINTKLKVVDYVDL
jgi:hypothetical protein